MERRRPRTAPLFESSPETHAPTVQQGGVLAASGALAWFNLQSDARQRIILGKFFKAWRKGDPTVQIPTLVREHLMASPSRHHVACTEAHEFFLASTGTELLRAHLDADIDPKTGQRAGALVIVSGLHQIDFAIRDLSGRSPEQLGLTVYVDRRQQRERLYSDYAAGRVGIDLLGRVRKPGSLGTRTWVAYWTPPEPSPAGQGGRERKRPSASNASPSASSPGSRERRRPASLG